MPEKIGKCAFLKKNLGRVHLAFQCTTIDLTCNAYRVRVSGVRGSPPPSTTKCAVFYQGGYEAQLLLNATGYATSEKWNLVEKQIRHFLPTELTKDLETLQFQR
jgi:hypothetical protein